MKFSVLALDFDGTISRRDTLEADMREAIAAVRRRGIVVVLVTGRILEDLRRVTGGLHFVDAVVAENGAVTEFPASGHRTSNGPPPAPLLLEALTEAEVPFDAGEVVVEAAADDAPKILTIIRRLELPLTIAFNRGRLMVLPQTISKATGLKQALAILRLSPRNAIGIGDAENDHELLQVCEVGVAVDWGSAALKAAADYVLPGSGPPAVAAYIREMASHRRLLTPTRTRRGLLVGHTDAGGPIELAVRGRNLLIAGDSRSGKSWVAGLLCEQLILHGYSLCVLDPEGDYVSLEALPGVRVLGGAHPLPRPGDVVRELRHADVSLILDLSRAPHEARVAFMRNMLPALATLRRHTGLPHRIFLDEAHYFLHDEGVHRLVDFEMPGYTFVSYRPSHLHPDVLGAAEAIVVTRASDPRDAEALLALCAACEDADTSARSQDLLSHLVIGEAAVLPLTDESGGQLRRIRLVPRLTSHVRHQTKYVDVPVMESLGFVLWRHGSPSEPRIRTLREFVLTLEATGVAALKGHLMRNDFSRWIANVFGDHPLAEDVRRFENAFGTGQLAEPTDAICQAIRSRYEFVTPVLGDPP